MGVRGHVLPFRAVAARPAVGHPRCAHRPWGCEIEVEVHVNGALNVGLTPAEISEALLHSAVYCGVPRSINATLVAKKVFAERGLLPIANTTVHVLDRLPEPPSRPRSMTKQGVEFAEVQ
ncbi:carboxymuconolactone decarboxylase family protein [Streptosporangium lutulentum]